VSRKNFVFVIFLGLRFAHPRLESDAPSEHVRQSN